MIWCYHCALSAAITPKSANMEPRGTETILKEQGIFLKHDTVGGIPCVIGYDKKFKWSWMATQLNTFVIIGSFDGLIDKAVIENFSKACFEYGLKNNQGWPRGLQSGVASIAILQGKSIDRSASVFCEVLSKKHFSAFEISIIYDTEQKKTIKYLSKPLWGTIYFSYFGKLIESVTSKF